MQSVNISATNVRGSKVNGNYTTKKDFYHISFANECQICFETCVKPRRLPCEHEFCKECLKEYFKETNTDEDTKCFACPSCNSKIPVPNVPRHKWTKEYKIDKRTAFYTEQMKGSDVVCENGSDVALPVSSSVRRPIPSKRRTVKGVSRRTGVLFPEFGYCPGFYSKISTDETQCIYWGGDIFPTGEIIIPDWYNKTVKLFRKNGDFVDSVKLKHPPLDLTAIHENAVVVTYGSRLCSYSFLNFDEKRDKLTCTGTMSIEGRLYSTTRFGSRCLGLFEKNDGRITLATISVGGTVKLLDIGTAAMLLSSSSGIMYNQLLKRIYCTERKSLICLDSKGNVEFERSYPFLETDHYPLGSLTSDPLGHVFAASDHCILHISMNGDLINIIPTKLDPFYITMTTDGDRIVIVGKNENVEFYKLKETNA